MRRSANLLASALVVAVAVAVAATACSGSKPSITIKMVNFTYQPVDVAVAPGGSVEFTNGTSNVHNFTLIRGGSISFDVAAGASVTTDEIGKLKPGTYPFRCKYHFKQGMIGVLTVTGASP